jgi:hypothetical protein
VKTKRKKKEEDVEVVLLLPKDKLEFFKLTLPLMNAVIASIKESKDCPHLEGMRESLLQKPETS